MKLKLSVFFSVFLIGVSAHAQQERAGAEGQIQIFNRYNDSETNTSVLALRYNLQGWMRISESGCIRLKAEITPGPSYSRQQDAVFATDNRDINLHTNLRYLFVDAACVARNLQFSAGVIPVQGNGRLGLSDAGWVDGARVSFKYEPFGQSWTVTVGQVNQLNTPNLLQRDLTGLNFYQAELAQSVLKNHKVFVSVARRDGVQFTRAGLNFVIEQYVSWLEMISAEMLHSSSPGLSGSGIQGSIQEVNLKLGQWKLRSFRTQFDALSEDDRLKNQAKFYYGLGVNYYLFANRDLGRCKKWNTFFRARSGDDDSFVDVGLTLRFGGASRPADNCS